MQQTLGRFAKHGPNGWANVTLPPHSERCQRKFFVICGGALQAGGAKIDLYRGASPMSLW